MIEKVFTRKTQKLLPTSYTVSGLPQGILTLCGQHSVGQEDLGGRQAEERMTHQVGLAQ